MSEDTEYNPTSVSPPGATLADLLEMKGLTYVDLAKKTGVDEAVLRNIVTGVAPIMPVVAMALAQHVGGTAQFWMKREERYRSWLAKQEQEEEEEEDSEYTPLWDRFVLTLDVQARKDGGNRSRINGYLDYGTFQTALGEAGVWVRSAVVTYDEAYQRGQEAVRSMVCTLAPRRDAVCDDEGCPGWGWSGDTADGVVRCDTCRRFSSDGAAIKHLTVCEACQRALGRQFANACARGE